MSPLNFSKEKIRIIDQWICNEFSTFILILYLKRISHESYDHNNNHRSELYAFTTSFAAITLVKLLQVAVLDT